MGLKRFTARVIQKLGTLIHDGGEGIEHGSLDSIGRGIKGSAHAAASKLASWTDSNSAVLRCPDCSTEVVPSNQEVKYCPKCECMVKPKAKTVDAPVGKPEPTPQSEEASQDS
jgi:ribosomal protein L37AE/L43A